MRSSAVHTPLLDDSAANAAQAEALRQEGNELFKVGSYTALFHMQAGARFFCLWLAQLRQAGCRARAAWRGCAHT